MNFLIFLPLIVLLIIFVLYFSVKTYIIQERNEQKQKIAELFHDLKSPLTSILGYVELLQSKERSREQQEEFLGIIEFESEKLLQMLSSGMSESSKSSNSSNSTNCAKILSLISRGLAPDASKKNSSIEYNCDPNLYVDFEESKLWRVISNLAENSVKYNKPGGITKLSAYAESDYVVIECEDTGIGIRSENIAKVFNKGFRENNKLPGFGYGLYTVRKIVSENGGHIQLQSEFGVGTKFTLKLRKAANISVESSEKSIATN